MATFGYTTVGTNLIDWYGWANTCWLSRETLTEAGDVSKLTCSIRNTNSGHAATNVKAVIYSDKSGPLPNALLGTGTAVAIADNLSLQWVDLPFASAVSLAAGTYWIGLLCDTPSAGVMTPLDSVAGTVYFESDTYSDGAMATRGAGTTYGTDRASIYATYAPPVTGTGHTSLIQFGIC